MLFYRSNTFQPQQIELHGMRNSMIEKILDFLNHGKSNWASSQAIIKNLGLSDAYSALELDEALLTYYKNTEEPEIRFSTLPSSTNLSVLWGSMARVGQRQVNSIYKRNTPLQIKNFNASGEKNLFMSYSFKDSDIVLGLAKKLQEHGMNPWIAEFEIMMGDHINQSVIDAIEALPAFGFFLTENFVKSSWSAKEISFATKHGKPIFGFIYNQETSWLETLNDSLAHPGSKLRDRIFSNLFFDYPNVSFLLYPTEIQIENLKSLGITDLIDWEELKVDDGQV